MRRAAPAPAVAGGPYAEGPHGDRAGRDDDDDGDERGDDPCPRGRLDAQAHADGLPVHWLLSDVRLSLRLS